MQHKRLGRILDFAVLSALLLMIFALVLRAQGQFGH
jgi:hypothetical protein